MKHLDIVTGSGRSGTTLLIKILSELGLTSVRGLSYFKQHRAGLEEVIGKESKIEGIPNIIKDPRLLTTTKTILDFRKDLCIDLAMLCVREYSQSAKSRVSSRLSFTYSHELPEKFGKTEEQRHVIFFQRAVGFFIETCAIYDIPLVVFNYPRFAKDKDYLFRKLTEECKYEIDYNLFEKVFNEVVVPEYIRTI